MSGAIGLVALATNLAVAWLRYRFRRNDSQALSVWLCSRNDCIGNLAVIAAGAGAWMSGTPWPDIAVVAITAGLELSSALRVVRQARCELSRRAESSDVLAECASASNSTHGRPIFAA